jgi:hypothetical protein
LLLLSSLWLIQSAAAQAPPRSLPDHPSHRYLPPPVGRGNLLEQVQSLERLTQEAESNRPQFELSPSQLEQLDAILENFRDENGQLNLPTPNSVPGPLIDSLLPNPKDRQQAKQMLEEYARSRNLKLPSNSNPSNVNPSSANPPGGNNPFDPAMGLPSDATSQASGDSSQPGLGSSSIPGASPRSSSQSSSSQGASSQGLPSTGAPSQNGSAQPPFSDGRPLAGQDTSPFSQGDLPKDTPPELRKLVETLKQFGAEQQQAWQEQQRQQGNAQSQPRSNFQNRNPNPANRNPTGANAGRTEPRAVRPTTPRLPPRNSNNKLRDRVDRQSPGSSPNGNRPDGSNGGQGSSRMRAAPQLTDNDIANGIGAGGASGFNGNADSSSGNSSNSGNAPDSSTLPKPGAGQMPDTNPFGELTPAKANEAPESKEPRLTPFDAGYDFSKDLQNRAGDPFAQAEDPTADPNANQAPTGRSARPAARPKEKPAEPFNVTRMAQQPPTPGTANQNQSGASKDPFEIKKSIRELGLGPAIKRIMEKTLDKNYEPVVGKPDVLNNAISQSPPASTPKTNVTEQLKQWSQSAAANPGATNNTSTSSNSQWGKWLQDAWRTVSSAPTKLDTNWKSTSAPAGSAGLGDSLPQVRWSNSMTVALLLAVGLIAWLVWFSRRRVAQLADASAAQAEWVRTVIASGLKTRADVVRAFHQLVKQSRAVSDWWTHRSIVKYFSKQTPQVASAISELAVVYEQARYYPDDVELSQQQLAQVRTLLESVKIPTTPRA